MPLHDGSSSGIISENIKEMQKAGHAHMQAVAAALENARKHPSHESRGGRNKNPQNLQQLVSAHPMAASAAAARSVAPPIPPPAPGMAGGGLTHMRPMKLKNPHPLHMGGMFKSDVPGRTDKLNISVPHNSYIIPADVVSGIGEGNSMAGGKALDHMFGTGKGLTGGSGFARGGSVPIVVAGGEYHVLPDAVTKLGNGNVDHGHKVLDEFVKHVREKTAKKMLKLPGPKK